MASFSLESRHRAEQLRESEGLKGEQARKQKKERERERERL